MTGDLCQKKNNMRAFNLVLLATLFSDSAVLSLLRVDIATFRGDLSINYNMNGAGFIKDMIARSKSNRRLLRGDKSQKYQSFDKSYITNSIISRKPPKYKLASPEYMTKLKTFLKRERRKEIAKNIFAAVFAIGFVVAGTMYFLRGHI